MRGGTAPEGARTDRKQAAANNDARQRLSGRGEAWESSGKAHAHGQARCADGLGRKRELTRGAEVKGGGCQVGLQRTHNPRGGGCGLADWWAQGGFNKNGFSLSISQPTQK
jgi:hypothetical protein